MAISYSIHHSFSTELAKKYGIEEAILIHHFQHWITHNKKLNRNFKEGRTWSYQTQKEMAAWFPYLKLETIKYTLENLVKAGVLIRKKLNKNPIDKTWWYAFEDEDLFVGENSKNIYDTENSVSTRKKTPPIPDTITSDTKHKKNPPQKKERTLSPKRGEEDSSSKKKPIKPPPPKASKPPSSANLEAKLKETGRTNPKLLELALQKLKEQPLGEIKSPFSWLKKVYDNLLDQEKMNDLVEFRKRFVFAKKKSWLPGKDKVTVLSGSLETSYSYRGNEEFWVKHGLGMEDYLKHLEKIEKGKEE